MGLTRDGVVASGRDPAGISVVLNPVVVRLMGMRTSLARNLEICLGKLEDLIFRGPA